MSQYLPSGYSVPKATSNYMKFDQGDNHFRILSEPILGWLDWKDKKPVRTRFTEPKPQPIDPKKPVKHFWAFVVWDYNESDIEKRLKILEVTQAGIQQFITNHVSDPDWGDPRGYDLVIRRQGEGLETVYDTMAKPPKPMHEEISRRWADSNIDLEQLFIGGDPFKTSTDGVQTESSASINVTDIPF